MRGREIERGRRRRETKEGAGPGVEALLREAVARYVLALILGLWIYFALALLWDGAPFPLGRGPGTVGLLVLWPALVCPWIPWLTRDPDAGGPAGETARSPWLWLAALVLGFGFWAGGYFALGAVTTQLQPVALALALDARIPRVQAFVFPYLLVYPMFWLAFPLARDDDELARVFYAQVLALGLSYILFLVLPVHFPHPALTGKGLAAWALGLIYGGDPKSNCFPSTHVVAATVGGLALARRGGILRFLAWAGILGVALATLFVRQHYVLDVVAGGVIATLGWLLAPRLAARYPLAPLTTWLERLHQALGRGLLQHASLPRRPPV